jgi:hypothetical protein
MFDACLTHCWRNAWRMLGAWPANGPRLLFQLLSEVPGKHRLVVISGFAGLGCPPCLLGPSEPEMGDKGVRVNSFRRVVEGGVLAPPPKLPNWHLSSPHRFVSRLRGAVRTHWPTLSALGPLPRLRIQSTEDSFRVYQHNISVSETLLPTVPCREQMIEATGFAKQDEVFCVSSSRT